MMFPISYILHSHATWPTTHQTVSQLREDGSGAALSTLCWLFGYRRQAYNKRDDKDGFAEDAIDPIIMEKAREYRKTNPGLGASKLLENQTPSVAHTQSGLQQRMWKNSWGKC